MTQNKTLGLLLGFAVGLALTAVAIGLLLVGTALVLDLRAGDTAVLLQHPLYLSGRELVFSGLLAGLPLFAVGYFWRRQQHSLGQRGER